jgi:hypothetical protein
MIHVPPKHRLALNGLHDVMSQKTKSWTSLYVPVGFEVLTAVAINIIFLWDMMPCTPVKFADVSEDVLPPSSGSMGKPSKQQTYYSAMKTEAVCSFEILVLVYLYQNTRRHIPVPFKYESCYCTAILLLYRSPDSLRSSVIKFCRT